MNTDKITEKRHSLAHLLASAVLKKYPDTKLGIGPVIENGFYYDFLFPEGVAITEKDLKEFEKGIKKQIGQNLSFEKMPVSKEEALSFFGDQPFKKELINDLSSEGKDLTLYKTGDFTDLCRGGHVEHTKEIDPDAFSLGPIAGAYWKGDEKNLQLIRIYGLLFDTKEELDAHIQMIEEAKKRDHKKVGKELDLFTFSDTVGKGLPLFTPKGSIIRRELERFIVDEEIRRGYLHVYTPDLAKVELYEKSGHYPHYKDSMYAPIEIDEERFMLRPMTCPHHFELYLRAPHSYRELPMRIAELAQLYRYEQSGELSGLQRVRSFCLADAHIICAGEEQAVEEVAGALDLIEHIASVFGLKQGTEYWYRLSLGDRENEEKYYKNDSGWEKGENLLRELLVKRGSHFVEAKGEAAFYGPKIDIQMKNVNGKEDTAFTVQYDFCMPERFNLTYKAADGTDKQPIVVHRSSIGAIERIMAFLIEHYGGAFPLWLSPVQVAILSVGENHKQNAKELSLFLRDKKIRVSLLDEDESLGKKIRSIKTDKTPAFIVVGDKEIESGVYTIEYRNGEKEELSKDTLLASLLEKIENKK